MAMTREEICEKVTETLVDALGVDEEEVTDEATLMGDLGAESIDFLDIVFRLEKAFDIKIAREELFPAESLLNDSELVSNNKLTDKGLAMLKDKMPHSDLSDYEKVLKGAKEIQIIIGPEGGLSETELTLAKESSVKPFTFGPRILRTETAAIAALSLIMLNG